MMRIMIESSSNKQTDIEAARANSKTFHFIDFANRRDNPAPDQSGEKAFYPDDQYNPRTRCTYSSLS